MRSAPYLLLCCLLLLVSGQAPAPTGGTITGEVEYDKNGTILTAPKDTKDIWVYLEDQKRSRTLPGKGVTATITQKGRQFSPKVLVVPLGATVQFPNKDSEPHNVFSPPVGSDAQWDLGRHGPKVLPVKKLLELNAYEIYCDLHMEMRANIKVVPSRYFVAVKNGKYTFANIPPGRYKVGAWAPGSDDVHSDVITVVAGATTVVPLLNPHWGALSSVHLRADGTPYPPGGVYKPPPSTP